MRISVVIFAVLMTQTSASFFSELTSSVSSVRFSVGKLLGDAAVDLKDTFDCTVFAVRQAFWSYSTVPDYYQKCQGGKAEDTIPLVPSRPVQININPIVEPTFTDISRRSQSTNREQNNLKFESKAADTNSNNKIEKKIQSVESNLLGETRVLANMSLKLEHEFEGFSKHVNDDFMKIENDQKQLSIEKVMQEIDKLHGEEATYRNNTESEIRDVFYRLISSDSINNNSHKTVLKEEIKAVLIELERYKNKTHLEHGFEKWKEEELKRVKEEIKAVLTELEQYKNKTHLEHGFEKWKEEELKSLKDIKDLLKKQEHNFRIKPDQTSITTSNPSKTPKKYTETVSTTKPVTFTETGPSADIITSAKATVTTPLVLTTTKPAKTTKASLIQTNNYHYPLKKDKTLGQALKIFSNSKKTALLMAKILKSPKSVPSVFDHPGLLIGR